MCFKRKLHSVTTSYSKDLTILNKFVRRGRNKFILLRKSEIRCYRTFTALYFQGLRVASPKVLSSFKTSTLHSRKLCSIDIWSRMGLGNARPEQITQWRQGGFANQLVRDHYFRNPLKWSGIQCVTYWGKSRLRIENTTSQRVPNQYNSPQWDLINFQSPCLLFNLVSRKPCPQRSMFSAHIFGERIANLILKCSVQCKWIFSDIPYTRKCSTFTKVRENFDPMNSSGPVHGT